jgi:hypothetical protein
MKVPQRPAWFQSFLESFASLTEEGAATCSDINALLLPNYFCIHYRKMKHPVTMSLQENVQDVACPEYKRKMPIPIT